MGEIVAIWIKRAHGGTMDRVETAQLIAGRGLLNNADQGGRRQITLIDEAAWDMAQEELGLAVDPAARRANVLLRGIDLQNSLGKSLRLGECVIRIFGETRPCHLMEEMQPGLRRALGTQWRGGAFGEIVQGGMIGVGDGVSWSAE